MVKVEEGGGYIMVKKGGGQTWRGTDGRTQASETRQSRVNAALCSGARLTASRLLCERMTGEAPA